MTKEELLKNLYYDLKISAAYTVKSKLFEEAGNHLRMTKDELLKKLYYDFKNPAAYAGKSELLQEAKKLDSNISIEDVHQIDGQWQIDLVYMSKHSKHNDGLKFIMMMMNILSKYVWLQPLKSKHSIAIKNTLEHIFSEIIRLSKVIQTKKGT